MAKNKKKAPAESPAPAVERAPESAPAAAPLSAPSAASVIPSAAKFIRVRMRAKAMGPGVCLEAGQQYTLAAKFAADLIAGGYAVEIKTNAQREMR